MKIELPINTILCGDVLKKLRTLPDRSVQCVVTSPPYWGLRDYGVKGQLGLESTPEKYINKLVKIFRECRRVLKNDGTLWLNIADSYAHTGAAYAADNANITGRQKGTTMGAAKRFSKTSKHLKAKDLVGIPWMLAFALSKDGWFLRSEIIWHKPNPMPESVTDRPTKSHESIFLLSKSSKYYYDAEAIKEPIAPSSQQRLSQDIANQKGSDRVPGKTNGAMKAVGLPTGGAKHKNLEYKGLQEHTFHRTRNQTGEQWQSADGKANKKSVWIVPTTPYKDAHFATFPQALITAPIKAGRPEHGIVLDPFMGSGTTAIVARKLGRNFIGIELNKEYVKIAEKRLQKELGLFL